jgi:hypothetical protein
MKFKRRKLFIKSIRDEIVGARCPRCGAAADGGTCVDDVEAVHMPKAGDLAICLYCGAFNKYQADLTQREMTGEELRQLEDDPHMAGLLETAARITATWRKKYLK